MIDIISNGYLKIFALFHTWVNRTITRPDIIQCTGSIIEQEIIQTIWFPNGWIIDLNELGDVYQTGRIKCVLQIPAS